MSGSQLGNIVTFATSLVFFILAIAAYVKKRRHLAAYLAIAGYVFFLPVRLWFWQFAWTDRAAAGSGYIWTNVTIQIVMFGIIPLIASCFFRFRPVLTALFIAYVFSVILQLFSGIYWSYGTTKNFNVSLTHLDSFYFALGTLTTAGTGIISATSETALRIQTLQMTVDFIFVGFALTLVLARYSSLLDRRTGAVDPKAKPTSDDSDD